MKSVAAILILFSIFSFMGCTSYKGGDEIEYASERMKGAEIRIEKAKMQRQLARSPEAIAKAEKELADAEENLKKAKAVAYSLAPTIYPNPDLFELTPEQRQAVYDGVRRSLKDPDSAKFGDMYAARGVNDNVTVCGYVNAKNSFGGYAGMSPYIGLLVGPTKDSFAVIGMGSGRNTDTLAVLKLCEQEGIRNL